MKRRYKLLLIIVIGALITIIISNKHKSVKLNITSLGDSLSIGMTPYNVAGKSFNDYIKNKLEKKNKLNIYNNEFSESHYTLHELLEDTKKNKPSKYSKIPIQQIIEKSDIITIAIGIDEFADKSLVEDINLNLIDSYILEYSNLLQFIRDFYDNKIIVISLYPAYNFFKKDAVDVNEKLKKLCGKYNASFLDILALSLNNEYYLEKNSYYLNYKAHEKIAYMLDEEIQKSLSKE